MSVRYAPTVLRRWAVAVTAAGLVLGVAGCGSDDEPPKSQPASTSSASRSPEGDKQPQSEEPEAPEETLALLKGQSGFELTITSAQRDAGGFLTVKGRLKNSSDKGRAVPDLRGNETEVLKHGTSLGGATLLDVIAKKRYYVLRDTDGRPLTTTGLAILGAGDSAEVFMQFPAPPAGTAEVTFQLPTFEPGTIKLS
ncbi:hypothetical protein Q5762_08935 [Streptomyces sp. P9(2023)]|uniref:hypothetical protein n=1 Tax=Streptomyces sp. P9(2023) TaxID=3064394 RepID=UPI0028F41914|nr:hypothetical protein [Streptomyces sp. P9(2023)]MDT9688475.1 hypothetical protein [Streptomyces sp. P9(2023)]